MTYKDKITISISKSLLTQIDNKIDKVNFKNRSHVIDSLVREWLKLRQDVWAVILAHEKKWNSWEYPLDIPKVLIKIDGKTLLEKHLENLKTANIDNVVIAVSYKKEMIIDFVNKKFFWLKVTFLDVNEDDLSLKIISEANKILDTNKILTILGDNYFYPLNLTDFIYYHNINNSDLTIIVSTIDLSNWYWNIKLEWNNIVKFVEKPKTKEDISYLINAWIYLMDSSKIPSSTENLKIEKALFPDFVKKAKVKAYFHNWKYFHIQDDKILKLFNN